MKTIVLLIVSSIFLSSTPKNIEKDSIEKIISYKIENTVNLRFESTMNSRTPIIILKKD